MSDTFQFKNFTISQDRCAMKVGTDGVLLGAWARGGRRILDVGTGTGLIALMMAQRYADAEIEGIEINAQAARQACENVAVSPYAGRIKVHSVALQQYAPTHKYDAIVSNPPFFSNSLPSPDLSRRQARQTDTLPFRDLFAFTRQWLADEGEISAVIPKLSVDEFCEQAFLQGLFIARRFDVKTVEHKQAKRILISFSKSRPAKFESGTITITNKDGGKTAEYADLTKNFYATV